MTTFRPAVSRIAMVLALWWTFCFTAGGQKVNKPGPDPHVMLVDPADNGRYLAATVGQQIEISLGAMKACEPLVSSDAIRLESVAENWPPTPGLSTHVYIFHAASAGEAQVRIPISDCSNPDVPAGFTFAVTFHVEGMGGEESAPYARRTPDQTNTAPWAGGWTIVLANDLRQSFKPSLPRLTGVELELVEGNPNGSASSEVTVTLLNAKEEILSIVSRAVPVEDCDKALFVFPKGGWPVTPGEVYSIGVRGGEGVFGWKYVAGGYARGAASFNGKPLLQGARSTFLFRTFGAS